MTDTTVKNEIENASGVLQEIEKSGIRVSIPRLQFHLDGKTSELKNLLNENNVKNVKYFKILAIAKAERNPSHPRTEKGAISLAAPLIERFHELVFDNYTEAISVQRKITLLKKYISQAKNQDSRLYAAHKINSAVGRVYVGEFQYTNLPKNFRDAILPEEGQKFWELDIDRAEITVLAMLAKDEKLLSALDHSDFHTCTASELFSVPFENVTFDQRAQAKIVIFSIIYGATEYFLARKLGISVTDAEGLLNAFARSYQKSSQYLEKIGVQGEKTGSAVTAFGTARKFSYSKSIKKSCVSHNIQSTAGELARMAIRYVASAASAFGGELKMTLFDSYILSLPTTVSKTAIKVLSEQIEKIYSSVGFDLKLSISYHGDSWK